MQPPVGESDESKDGRGLGVDHVDSEPQRTAAHRRVPSSRDRRVRRGRDEGPVVRVTITIDAHKARKKQVKKKLLAKTVVSI